MLKVIGEYSGLEDLNHRILEPDGGKTQHAQPLPLFLLII